MSADPSQYRCVIKPNTQTYALKTWAFSIPIPDMPARDRAKVERIVRRIKRLRRGNARHARRLRHWDNELWRRYGVAYLRSRSWSTALASPPKGLTIRNFSL